MKRRTLGPRPTGARDPFTLTPGEAHAILQEAVGRHRNDTPTPERDAHHPDLPHSAEQKENDR